ncbi:hypothetical protein JL722_7757 [Aureococcus anophagefferens]|nr:hypothetical protein JL722_7757 [Aureococcus anophagefferens]
MGRRQRNEERTKRFQEHRVTRGVDVATLDMQVKDNQRKKDDDADLDKQYADMAAKVSFIVEERRLADEEERLGELRRLKEDWDEHAALPKNNSVKIAAPIDMDTAGLASAQRLLGEDRDAGKRKSRQAAQMRSWTLEQMELKKQGQRVLDDEDERFAAWEKHVLAQRTKIEQEQRIEAKMAEQDLRAYRGVQAAERRGKEADQRANEAKMDADEIERNLADPRARGIKRVYKENEAIQKYRDDAALAREADDAAYDDDVANVQTLVTAADYQVQEAKRHELMMLKEDLEKQRFVERQRKVDEREEAFGSIGEGVLSGFGSSYR